LNPKGVGESLKRTAKRERRQKEGKDCCQLRPEKEENNDRRKITHRRRGASINEGTRQRSTEGHWEFVAETSVSLKMEGGRKRVIVEAER